MKKDTKEKKSYPVTVDITKMVPKFCTGIQASLLNNSNIVLTFVYSEQSSFKDENNDNVTSIIDRVVIDKRHSIELEKLLNQINNHDEKSSD